MSDSEYSKMFNGLVADNAEPTGTPEEMAEWRRLMPEWLAAMEKATTPEEREALLANAPSKRVWGDKK